VGLCERERMCVVYVWCVVYAWYVVYVVYVWYMWCMYVGARYRRRLPWVTVGDPGLGTKVGTRGLNVR